MSSSFVKDCTDASGSTSNTNKTVIIIVNNEPGNVTLDGTGLQNLLASHGAERSQVSVVQMGGGNILAQETSPLIADGVGGLSNLIAPSGVPINFTIDGLSAIPIEGSTTDGYAELPLDVEALQKLESVLESDEARKIFGEPLLDIVNDNAHNTGELAAILPPSDPTLTNFHVKKRRGTPKRRSQRQVDRAEREEVVKILAENQLMLRKEREELQRLAQESEEKREEEKVSEQRETDAPAKITETNLVPSREKGKTSTTGGGGGKGEKKEEMKQSSLKKDAQSEQPKKEKLKSSKRASNSVHKVKMKELTIRVEKLSESALRNNLTSDEDSHILSNNIPSMQPVSGHKGSPSVINASPKSILSPSTDTLQHHQTTALESQSTIVTEKGSKSPHRQSFNPSLAKIKSISSPSDKTNLRSDSSVDIELDKISDIVKSCSDIKLSAKSSDTLKDDSIETSCSFLMPTQNFSDEERGMTRQENFSLLRTNSHCESVSDTSENKSESLVNNDTNKNKSKPKKKSKSVEVLNPSEKEIVNLNSITLKKQTENLLTLNTVNPPDSSNNKTLCHKVTSNTLNMPTTPTKKLPKVPFENQLNNGNFTGKKLTKFSLNKNNDKKEPPSKLLQKSPSISKSLMNFKIPLKKSVQPNMSQSGSQVSTSLALSKFNNTFSPAKPIGLSETQSTPFSNIKSLNCPIKKKPLLPTPVLVAPSLTTVNETKPLLPNPVLATHSLTTKPSPQSKTDDPADCVNSKKPIPTKAVCDLNSLSNLQKHDMENKIVPKIIKMKSSEASVIKLKKTESFDEALTDCTSSNVTRKKSISKISETKVEIARQMSPGESEIRRSGRPVKKKTFGDDILFLDDKAVDSEEEHHSSSDEEEEASKIKVQTIETESDEEQDEEIDDDPDKLWCICRKPHSNRFMICCDRCEDWFHGSCVGISKLMGKQMEEKEQEWICPNCKKVERAMMGLSSLPVKDQKKNGKLSQISSSKPTKISYAKSKKIMDSKSEMSPKLPKKSKEKPAKVKEKTEPRVLVYEKATGIVLSGTAAPTLDILGDWLQDNPAYTTLQPTMMNSIRIDPKTGMKKINLEDFGLKPVVHKKTEKPDRSSISLSKFGLSSPKSPTKKEKIAKLLKQNEIMELEAARKSESAKKKSLSPMQFYKDGKTDRKRSIDSSEDNYTPKKPKETPAKKTVKSPEATIDRVVTKPDVMKVRLSVRKVLFDALEKRKSETGTEFEEMTDKVLRELCREIEEQLFITFNKDVGFKYKSRYRSLVFNIKDSKNSGLFRKILNRSIRTEKLATMTSDDLASKELAEWREREEKKEIEAIEKHELELLAIGNQYIMKSHKGEMLIDKDEFSSSKSKDIESVISLAPDASKLALETPPQEDDTEDMINHKNHIYDPTCKICSALDDIKERVSVTDKSRRNENDREKRRKDSDSSSYHSSRHKKKDKDRRHSHKSRDKERSRSRDRKDRSRSKDRKDRSRSRDRKDRSRSRDRKDRSRSKDRKDRSRSRDRKDKDRSRHERNKEDRRRSRDDRDRRKRKHSGSQKRKESDSGSHSKKEEEAKNKEEEQTFTDINTWITSPTNRNNGEKESLPPQSSLEESSLISSPATPPLSELPTRSPPIVDDDSLLSPATPPLPDEGRLTPPPHDKGSDDDIHTPIWKGVINMPDVSKFAAAAFEVSGKALYFTEDVPSVIEVVGRINPDNVWGYIAQMKKSGSKEILAVRFQPSSEEEKVSYIALYSYLSSKKRYGVIGNCEKSVKDFYIVPLASHQPIPQVLLPLDGPGFEESRPHMLIGVIVRTKHRRVYDPIAGSWVDIGEPQPHQPTHRKSQEMLQELESERSFTPPPISVPLLPETKSEIVLDEDSPEDVYTPSPLSTDDVSVVPTEDVASAKSLERESMLAELNRQIERDRKELSLMQKEVDDQMEKGDDVPTLGDLDQSGDVVAPSENPESDNAASLDKISIPSNLHEILNSIKRKEEAIQEKENEIKRRLNMEEGGTPPPQEVPPVASKDVDLRLILSSAKDEDLRLLPGYQRPAAKADQDLRSRDPRVKLTKKPDANVPKLSTMSDADIVAKAMEMEGSAEFVSPNPAFPLGPNVAGPPPTVMPMKPQAPHGHPPSVMTMKPQAPHGPPSHSFGPPEHFDMNPGGPSARGLLEPPMSHVPPFRPEHPPMRPLLEVPLLPRGGPPPDDYHHPFHPSDVHPDDYFPYPPEHPDVEDRSQPPFRGPPRDHRQWGPEYPTEGEPWNYRDEGPWRGHGPDFRGQKRRWNDDGGPPRGERRWREGNRSDWRPTDRRDKRRNDDKRESRERHRMEEPREIDY